MPLNSATAINCSGNRGPLGHGAPRHLAPRMYAPPGSATHWPSSFISNSQPDAVDGRVCNFGCIRLRTRRKANALSFGPLRLTARRWQRGGRVGPFPGYTLHPARSSAPGCVAAQPQQHQQPLHRVEPDDRQPWIWAPGRTARADRWKVTASLGRRARGRPACADELVQAAVEPRTRACLTPASTITRCGALARTGAAVTIVGPAAWVAHLRFALARFHARIITENCQVDTRSGRLMTPDTPPGTALDCSDRQPAYGEVLDVVMVAGHRFEVSKRCPCRSSMATASRTAS